MKKMPIEKRSKKLISILSAGALAVSGLLIGPLPSVAVQYGSDELVLRVVNSATDARTCLAIGDYNLSGTDTFELDIDWGGSGFEEHSSTLSQNYSTGSGIGLAASVTYLYPAGSNAGLLLARNLGVGEHTIRIKPRNGNDLTRYGVPDASLDSSCRNDLVQVIQWGNWVNDWTRGFQDQLSLTTVPNSTPGVNPTSFASMFSGATSFNSPIGSWDVSSVSDFSRMFYLASAFNQDIGNWNTSAATTFARMFNFAGAFNKDIGNWNTSSVTDFSFMFYLASAFNQDIGNWDTSAATNIRKMFEDASAFNQDIGNWDVSSVVDFSDMFEGASAFNQDIGNWSTTSATDFSDMFKDAIAFNQYIGAWDTTNVTSISDLFDGATAYTYCLPEVFFPASTTYVTLGLAADFGDSCVTFVPPSSGPQAIPSVPYLGPVNLDVDPRGLANGTANATGSNLDTVTTVSVNGSLTTFRLNSDGSITFDIPDLPVGKYPVTFFVQVNSVNLVSTIEITGRATAAVSEEKILNAGTFDRYVAVYAKGYAGSTLTWKIAGKWFKTELTEDYQVFQRPTIYRNFPINVELYIDGERLFQKNVLTK
jgi:surface protein